MNIDAARKQVLRTNCVYRRLGISRATLWRWVRAGHFPSPIVVGPAVRGWTESQVDAWIEERRQESQNA